MATKRFPHTYVIIFYIIVISAILTWIVPGGEFNREKITIDGIEREVIVNNSYHEVENQPQSWQVFSALLNGFIERANIIGFILILGGAFWILNRTDAINYGIRSALQRIRKFERFGVIKKLGIDNLIIAFIMLLFSVFGATFGMSEETIAFVIIFVPLAISMGYDSIIGVAMCFVAAGLGFAGAILNPFTVGIAQGISDLQLFSGMGYRLFCWVVINLVGIGYILIYAKKIRKDISKSPVSEDDQVWKSNMEKSDKLTFIRPGTGAWITFVVLSGVFVYLSFAFTFTDIKLGNTTYNDIPILPVTAAGFIISSLFLLRKSIHFFILNLLIFTILFLVIGVLGYGWYITKIATLFFALGLIVGIIMNYSPNNITRYFIDGVKDITSAALVVGLAGGIIIILEEGKIIDTLLYHMAESMKGTGKVGSVGAMYFFQTLINIFIPSGSAQAALTMPIMSQFSDLVGISRQTAVLVFQLGDGFTNMITPTSGILIGVLGVAKIPYSKWFKWALPFIALLIITGFLLLLPPLFMELSGF